MRIVFDLISKSNTIHIFVFYFGFAGCAAVRWRFWSASWSLALWSLASALRVYLPRPWSSLCPYVILLRPVPRILPPRIILPRLMDTLCQAALAELARCEWVEEAVSETSSEPNGLLPLRPAASCPPSAASVAGVARRATTRGLARIPPRRFRRVRTTKATRATTIGGNPVALSAVSQIQVVPALPMHDLR